MVDAIHVRLAVSACDRCPVAALSTATPVEDVRVDPLADRVEFVVDDPPEEPPDGVEVAELGGRAHGRYDLPTRSMTDGGVERAVPGGQSPNGPRSDDDPGDGPVLQEGSPTADDGVCDGCSCGGLSAAFAAVPATPHDARMEDGELIATFALTGREELTEVVDAFERAGLDVDLRRLVADRDPNAADDEIVPIDLGGLTDRQAEIARVAVDLGYFDGDGASAAAVADEVDLAKSTVSEHLRAVTDALFSQAFRARGGI